MGSTILGLWDTSFNKEANNFFPWGTCISWGESDNKKYIVNIISKSCITLEDNKCYGGERAE